DLRRNQILRVWMRRRRWIGILQDRRPKRRFEVDGVRFVAFQRAVEIKGATRSGTCDDGNVRALAIGILGRTFCERGVVSLSFEAGQCHDIAATTFYLHATHRGISICSAARAARAWVP